MKKKYKYLFGPVPSRRLGLSLGVDLVPHKTCSMNCIFCQLGNTARTTIERREYVPTEDVLAEISDWQAQGGQTDVITLSGGGEPTLHSRFGEVIDFVKAKTRHRTVILSNGSLLHLPEVRREAARADIVKITLASWDEDSFRKIHRPPAEVTFARIIEGACAFRNEFTGEIWLEVFVIPGINAEPEKIRKIAGFAEKIRPDKIHLNTAVRPAAEKTVQPVPAAALQNLTGLFNPPAEVIASFAPGSGHRIELHEESVLALVRLHPCTAENIARMCKITPAEAAEFLDSMMARDIIRREEHDGTVWYVVN
ncbi:MAG TPA: radical SAM protein [Kiritimatiellia bacterium]|nr:radical SAM protein [Kiritimatiellia bacterium]